MSTSKISPPRLSSPPRVLDRSAFTRTIPVLAAQINASRTAAVQKELRQQHALVRLPSIPSVVDDPRDVENGRMLLLDCEREDQLAPETRQTLREERATIIPYAITLDYDYWDVDDIISSIVPPELSDISPAGYAVMGHIAHLNLNPPFLPYKHIIGEVILDKRRDLRTVVNKLGTINAQFRFFDMELVAGEPDFVVEHHETGCVFNFDFTKVYYNPRLSTEHARLVKLFTNHKDDGVILDVFAGVGPFALPAAKGGCAVMANDLNPECVHWMKINLEKNKVRTSVRVSELDGREYLRRAPSQLAENPFPQHSPPVRGKARNRGSSAARRGATSDKFSQWTRPTLNRISHIVMNLPDSAIEFLCELRGALSTTSLKLLYAGAMPMVHVHCFTRELDRASARKDIVTRIQQQLQYQWTKNGLIEDEFLTEAVNARKALLAKFAMEASIPDVNVEGVQLHLVRSVAPGKDMYCASFRLPEEVAFAAVSESAPTSPPT